MYWCCWCCCALLPWVGAQKQPSQDEGEEGWLRGALKDSLPAFAQVRTYWRLVLQVLKNKHDW